MANRLDRKINKRMLFLILILLILIIVNLILYVKLIAQPNNELKSLYGQSMVKNGDGRENDNSKKENTPVARTDEEIIRQLSTQGEWDRMDYYYGVYFKHLEKKEYEEAYNLLYDQFKKNYFPTLDEYISYIEKTYPAECAWVDEDISRQGNIYVLKMKIIDTLGSRDDEKEQRVVIRENNYNDFELSFQVI